MARQPESAVVKLLVVDLHHLGDAVMALPFLRGARKQFETRVVCRPPVRPVFARALPGDRIHTWEPPWHEESRKNSPLAALRETWREAGRWRSQKFDLALCVWADSRVHAMFAMAGIPRRIGFPMNPQNYYAAEVDWRAQKLRRGRQLAVLASLATLRPLLTDPLQRASARQHHMESWEQIARHLVFAPDASPPWLESNPAHTPLIGDLASGRNRKLLIHTGGRLPTKRWPLDRFQALLDGPLADLPGWSVFIVSGPGEPLPEPRAANQHVLRPASVDALIDLAGEADLTLCNDSFAGHLAAAWGRKALVIFGSGEPAWFAPGKDMSTVIGPSDCPFHPCVDVCRQPRIICLEGIPVEMVESRLKMAMAAFPKASGH